MRKPYQENELFIYFRLKDGLIRNVMVKIDSIPGYGFSHSQARHLSWNLKRTACLPIVRNTVSVTLS